MSVRGLAAAACLRALDRLEALARADLPPDVLVEREGDGLRLTGRGLARRWLVDGRLHGLAASAARGRR